MRTTIVKIICCLGIGMAPIRIFAQSPVRSTSEQLHTWVMSSGLISFDSSKVALFYDLQMRRADMGINSQQSLNRIGAIYQFNKTTSLGLGYAFVITSPYGDFPVKNQFFEHRIWEQLQLRQNFPRSNLTHRYRLEQRWLGDAEKGRFEAPRLENRARYFVKYQYNLRRHDKHPVFLNCFDEIFVNFGPAVTRNLFDQNRIGGSVGLGVLTGLTLELGYLNQYVLLRGLTNTGLNKLENNHTITAAILWNPKLGH